MAELEFDPGSKAHVLSTAPHLLSLILAPQTVFENSTQVWGRGTQRGPTDMGSNPPAQPFHVEPWGGRP